MPCQIVLETVELVTHIPFNGDTQYILVGVTYVEFFSKIP